MKRNSMYAIFVGFLLWAEQGNALTLSLNPNSQIITPTGIATVELVASDLGGFTSPTIGAFFVEIFFDKTVISFDSVEYGIFLGDSTDPFDTDIVTTIGTGSVELDEFSFLFDFELDALQPDSFTLATLTFTGLTVGTSLLDFGLVDISDAVGSSLMPAMLASSEITVSAVPLPGALLLMVSGLSIGGILGYRRR